MRKYIILPIVIMVFMACKEKDTFFNEVKDKDLCIQAMPLPVESGNNNEQSFKVRLLPDKKIIETITRTATESLSYRMDSCFYINKGNTKVMASMVQPVANGIKGSYEYLLVFEQDKGSSKDSIVLVYQDKYINHKTYQLKLAQRN